MTSKGGVGNKYIVDYEGLAKFRKDLIKADKRFGPEIRNALKATAEVVASDARGRVPVLTGKAKGSIKGGSSGAAAVVRGGQKKVPYYGWLDFGGPRSPKGRLNQRPFLKDGRYLYPAIAAKAPAARKKLEEDLTQIIERGTSQWQ